ncbi:hypothetical protein FB451DRAFT_1280786 [Mycena latifolia]|nr:hypothetical protein FB451DRAFT_1280786 [Mycena latifolia]
MHPFRILFNPYARVYTLRFLLLDTIATTVIFSIYRPPYYIAVIAVCFFILVHHLTVLFRWPDSCLAVIDLAMGALEITITGYLFSLLPDAPLRLRIPLILLSALLGVSTIYRTASIVKSKDRIWSQSFDFLGCCRNAHPGYTPLTILMNRSLARPLVRGESQFIIFARAVILSCIALGVPAYGVYTIVVIPLNAQVYPRITGMWGRRYELPPDHATIVMSLLNGGQIGYDTLSSVQVSTRVSPDWDCTVNPIYVPVLQFGPQELIAVQCPPSWRETANISISIVPPPGAGGVYVWPVHGDLSPESLGLSLVADPTPVFPGSPIIGLISWTKRQIITGVGFISPSVTVFTAEVTSLQPHPSSDAGGSNITTLTLLQRDASATRFVQDTVDPSVLSGVATFGGFWTFLNGAFALVFGANVIYFAFGRRPLSALGVVHIFQRRALVRRWYEDFPAIQTEGGTPGSESAGIVAFIRERLVDLGEDPRASPDKDADESETHPARASLDALERGVHADLKTAEASGIEGFSHDRPATDSSLKVSNAGYQLDEIPLLDVDLGLGEKSRD